MGGMQRGVTDLANNLTQRGYKVTLVGDSAQTSKPVYPVNDAVEVINIHQWHELYPRTNRALYLKYRLVRLLSNILKNFGIKRFDEQIRWQVNHEQAVASWRAFLKANSPDIVLATLPGTFTVVIEAVQGLGITAIVNNRNNPEKDYSKERYTPTEKDLEKRKLAPALADGNIVLLQEFKAWFPPEIQAKTHVIPNFVYQVEEALWAHPETESETKTIITTGRYSRIKDQETLIRAFALLSGRYPRLAGQNFW